MRYPKIQSNPSLAAKTKNETGRARCALNYALAQEISIRGSELRKRMGLVVALNYLTGIVHHQNSG